jgi:hypothetical protein
MAEPQLVYTTIDHQLTNAGVEKRVQLHLLVAKHIAVNLNDVYPNNPKALWHDVIVEEEENLFETFEFEALSIEQMADLIVAAFYESGQLTPSPAD